MVQAVIKPPVRTAWAALATTLQIHDPDTDVANYVANGWPVSTQPPARQYWNWVLNYCMNGVRYFSRRGVVDWDALETYYINDVVLGSDGVLRQSLQNANTNNNPVSAPSFWGALNSYALSASLAAYETTAAHNTSLAAYYTSAQVNSLLTNYETIAALATTLASYETTAAHNASLAPYETTAAHNASLAAYLTIAAFNTSIAPYATTAYVQGNYYTAATVNSLLAAYTPLTSYNTLNAKVTALPDFRWGTVAVASGQPGTHVVFAPAFTSLDTVVICGGPNSNAFQTVSILSQDRTGFFATSSFSGAVCSWIAIGNN
jgi:hypothetical protein